MNLLRRNKTEIGNSGLVLEHHGEASVHDVEGETFETDSGVYRVEEQGRYWLDKPIPAGWVSVYVETNPEPVSERPPIGYDSRTLQFLVGPYLPHVVGAAFPGKTEIKPWMVILVAVGVAIALAVVAYTWFKRRFGV